MSWFSRFRSGSDKKAPAVADTPLKAVRPPWVEYPGIPPWDSFWRGAGEPWKTLIWEPYYNGLSKSDQGAYLEHWAVPQDWHKSYFDEARRQFWDHVDDPDE